jgi:hypothetical protein
MDGRHPGPGPCSIRSSGPDPPIAPKLGFGGGLEPRIGAVMSARLGHDFSSVRIHTEPIAAAFAQAIDARAYTVGRDIVFAPDQYQPGTSSGRRLLAHELVHVAQQGLSAPNAGVEVAPADGPHELEANQFSGGTRPGRPTRVPVAIARNGASGQAAATGRGSTLWYQSVLDAETQSRRAASSIWNAHLPFLAALRELCEAADAKDLRLTAAATKVFLVRAKSDPPDAATEASVSSVGVELVSRLFLLGLDAQSASLQTYFKARASEYYLFVSGTPYGPDVEAWEKITEDTRARLAASKLVDVEATINVAIHTIQGLDQAARALDPKEVATDRASRKAQATASTPSYDILQMAQEKRWSISAYEAFLVGQITEVGRSTLERYQLLMDDATASLGSSRNRAATDRARTVLVDRIWPALGRAYAGRSSPDVDVTRSEFTPKGGVHRDFFDTSRAGLARDVKIEFYDREGGSGFEKSLPLDRVLQIRRKQVDLLDELAGRAKDPKDPKGNVTPGSAENARILAASPLDLESAQDWRAFLVRRFQASLARTTSREEALTETIALLERYLSAFTVSTPYNIDEFGDSYLSRTFPRASTGQLIHDCGVYALRVAYMLSQVREQLGLRFRAIVLPVHVGLIISGDGLRNRILHSGHFLTVSDENLKSLAADWQSQGGAGPQRPLDPDRLIGDIAAGAFIHGVDIPYQLQDVPTPDKSDPSGAKHRAKLWEFYHRQVITTHVLRDSPKADIKQPELRYLELLEAQRAAHNREMVPAWHAATAVWNDHKRPVLGAFAEVTRAQGRRNAVPPSPTGPTSPAEKRADDDIAARDATYDIAIQPYLDDLKAPRARMQQMFDRLQQKRDEVSQMLKDHPELVGSHATVAVHGVLDIVSGEEGSIFDYFGRSGRPGHAPTDGTLRDRTNPIPPFAEQGSIEPID